MFHVNKGAIGIHIDGARDVCLHRVTVAGVSNTGKQGHTWPLPGEVTAADGGHPAQGRQRGYLGADARGMSISNSTHVYFQEMHVAQVHSFRGLARGIDIFNDASDVHCGSGNTIDAVSTLIDPKGDYTMGPKVGSAIGFRVSGASAPTTYGGHAIAITNIVSGAFEQAHIHSIGTEPSL